MSSHTEPSSTNDSISTSCYKSRLLATNWALRDQFLREIERIKNDSEEMFDKAYQRIASLESALELIEEQTHEMMSVTKSVTEIKPLMTRLLNKVKALVHVTAIIIWIDSIRVIPCD